MASPDEKEAGSFAHQGAQGCEWVRLPPMPLTITTNNKEEIDEQLVFSARIRG